jgi:hypothetical protein
MQWLLPIIAFVLFACAGLAAYLAGVVAGFRAGLRTGLSAHRCCGEKPGPAPLPELGLRAGPPFPDVRS